MPPPETIDVSATTQPVTEQPPRGMAIERRGEAPVAQPQVTAAQAKVEAIANLTMKAYERAATLEITNEEAAKLRANFPDEAFKPGAAGKENLIYIEHAFLRERLSEVFGMGKWAIVPRNRWAEEFTLPAKYDKPAIQGTRIYVEAMLVIRGCFVAEAVGDMDYYPKNNSQNYGDAVEGAKSAALRRCAKELGIGLQAWKKDWCEGWWARRKASGKGQAPPAATSRPPAAQTSQAKPGTQQAPHANKPPPASQPQFASDATRAWLVRQLEPRRRIAEEFFIKLENPAVLLGTERLEDLPYEFLPLNKDQFKLLVAKLDAFEAGGPPEHAFPPNPIKDEEKQRRAAKAKAAKPAEPPPAKFVPKQEAPANVPDPKPKKRDPEWFFDVVCPIPRRGMKKAEYVKSPDTVGSLYKEMKQGSDEAQKRLWGFAKHWEPQPFKTDSGKTYPISEADKLFREALDAFVEWESRHGQDTNAQPELPTEAEAAQPGPGPGDDDDIPM